MTWGKVMTGHTFFDAIKGFVGSHRPPRILEVGPGYGRLLSTLIEERIQFGSYVGLELSSARVRELGERFGSDRVSFTQGDVTTFAHQRIYDLIICSSTLEHLYPNCLQALKLLSAGAAENAVLALDFIDPMGIGPATSFHLDQGGTFIHVYSEPEVDEMHAAAQLRIIAKKNIVIGEGVDGPVKRLLVISTPML